MFRKDVNQLLKKFPIEEKYVLTDQARRSLNSIILNIAESTNKSTDKDMKLYIHRSHCSLDEVVACVGCALDDEYISQSELNGILKKAQNLAKQLNAFTGYLSKANH